MRSRDKAGRLLTYLTLPYSSHLDELPAHLGGRENSWRSLCLRGLSRNIQQWDGLEVGGKCTVAGRIREELLLLVPRVPCPLIGGENGIPPRMLRSPAAPPSSVVSTATHASQPATSSLPLPSTRHPARARTTAARMRHLYILGGTLKIVVPLALEEESSEDSLSDFEWEEEAEKLCSWIRQLALDDMDNVMPT
ncbi:unnamed protein product [Coregonus sp. 'balchen']|nr:unnamed protein product [Coregonus sp. 'balchen']